MDTPAATATLEDPLDRLARQAAYFRDLAELNMNSARIAGTNIERAQAAEGDTHKPTLDLSRATRGVILAVEAENHLFTPKRQPADPPPRAPAGDARRDPLRQALHLAAAAEPDPSVRTQMRRLINTGIEEALLADPAAETPLCDHFVALADALQLDIDLSKVSDEVLGMKSYKYPPPGSNDTGDPRYRSAANRPAG